MQTLAVLVLLALVFAPVADRLTHGPGALVAEADQLAWHAERGEAWQSAAHTHHDASDHDHSKPALLAEVLATKVAFSALRLRPSLQRLSGGTVAALRRPPRQFGPAC